MDTRTERIFRSIQTPPAETLLRIAAKFLPTNSQLAVEQFVKKDALGHAQSYIHGALVELWEMQRIDDATAQEAFGMLGMTSEQMAIFEKNATQ